MDTDIRHSPDLSSLCDCCFGSHNGPRQKNEDNYLVISPDSGETAAYWLQEERPTKRRLKDWPKQQARYAVADGMGGHSGGQQIAQAAMEMLMTFSPVRFCDDMASMIEKLHIALYDQFATGREKSPGTTLLVADLNVKTGHGIIANVGDSRAYHVYDSGSRQLTCDHTYGEFAWRKGEISRPEYERELLYNTNEIPQALGYGSYGLYPGQYGQHSHRFDRRIRLDRPIDLPPELALHADIKSFILGKGHQLMLSTDGLWSQKPDGLWHGPLTEHFLSEKEVSAQIDKSLKEEARDNITIVVFGYKRS